MWNVDTVITDGIDMPGLGIDGTPEYATWCETLGDAGQVFEKPSISELFLASHTKHERWQSPNSSHIHIVGLPFLLGSFPFLQFSQGNF
jgi:hypothetical protein